jgi:hypothetical protein
MTPNSACPGCGLVLAEIDGPAHRYIGASPACWALYGDVLATIYSDAEHRRSLQLVVDTYAVQHPGRPSRQAAQSVGIHLMTLCLCLERGTDPADGPRLHRSMVERPSFTWLAPPGYRGSRTVRDVAAAGALSEYEAVVRAWASDVWAAWSVHHSTVRHWLDGR